MTCERASLGASRRSPVTAAVIAGALFLACRGEAPPEQSPPLPEVEIVTVKPEPIVNRIEVAGRLQAVRTAEVRARVDGVVQERLYNEGSDVRQGQPLFRIDPRQMRAQLSAAEASLARAKATAANAQQDVNRYEGLVAQQAISQQEYDTAVARLRTAQADVAQMQAQVDAATLTLSYTTVTAPIAGRAGRAQVTEGALVSAAAGTLMTTIEQMDPIFANFSVASSEVLAIRRDIAAGTLEVPEQDKVPVRLILEDGTEFGLLGKIDFLDLRVDETTGSTAVRAEFPNPKRSILPGQFVRVRIDAGVITEGLLVPQRAVAVTPEGASVMLVGADDTVEARAVKAGELQGGSWAILDGLTAGERVIVEGLQKVRAGQKVRPVPATSGASSAPQPDERR
jgi:membrane fusion protein (multidrug efflux system)